MRSLLYRLTGVIMRGLLRLFSTWRVEGLENVPTSGPLILVANHLSNLDGPLIGASIPRRVSFIAKHDVVKSLSGRFLQLYGVRAMNEDSRDAGVFFWARKILKRDGTLLFFPEARRNLEGMKKATLGVALIAMKTQTPILPVALIGTESIGPAWRVMIPRGTFTVIFGKPFLLPEVQGAIGRPQLESMGEMIMQRVASLLPERYQGAYRVSDPNPPQPEAIPETPPETAEGRT
jgi:1-acyl-sn-glycerol-3-phosphate acyltransferase